MKGEQFDKEAVELVKKFHDKKLSDDEARKTIGYMLVRLALKKAFQDGERNARIHSEGG